MEKKEIIDNVSDVAGLAVGAAAGAGLGTAMAGPVGAVGGALAGDAIEKVFKWAGNEISKRILSKREEKRISDVMTVAKEKIKSNFEENKILRADDFFSELDNRTSAEEILEGTLIVAQKEYEERKIKYIANLYANIAFDESISREIADRLIKISSELTYRQLMILCAVGFVQIGKVPLKQDTYGEVSGLNDVSIASDIFDLYRKSLIFSSEAMWDAAGINPSALTLGGYGALLYNLMELPRIPLADKDCIDILIFLGALKKNK